MSNYNGGNAFPTHEFVDGIGDSFDSGMSLRDYFAAKAMQAFIPVWASGKENLDRLADTSYKAADAMLKARQE